MWRIREGGDPWPSTGWSLASLLEKASEPAEGHPTVAQRVIVTMEESSEAISVRALDVSLPENVRSPAHLGQKMPTSSREVVPHLAKA